MAKGIQKKSFEIDCVNRTKYESVDVFKNSIFEDVYQDAFLITQENMEENEARTDLTKADIFCNEDEVRNVIPFIGQRGMGKSSAMLSYAYFLKEYDSNNVPQEFRFKTANPSFCTLTKIDAATLTPFETLFDVILAKMWELFTEEMSKCGEDDYLYNRTREKFTEIKDSYVIYNAKDKNLSMVRQLKDLSKSLNLRKNFAELVATFLDCMVTSTRVASCDKYLVIPIDDLDMADECLEQVLEQLRIFLSVPKVIILTTLDVDKLLMHMHKRMAELYTKAGPAAMNEYEEKMAFAYAEQYIAKILPRNRRIYMPNFSGNSLKKLMINYGKYATDIYETNGDGKSEIGYVQYIGAALAKKLNVLLHPEYLIRETETPSLRDMANRINELWRISRIKDSHRAARMTEEWMNKDVAIMGNRMPDIDLKNTLDKILHIPEEMCNSYIIKYIDTTKNDNDTDDSYGKLMEVLLDYRNEGFQKRTFISQIMQLYSGRIAYLIKEEEYETIEEEFIKKNIFDTTVKRRANEAVGKRVDISQMMRCQIKLHDDLPESEKLQDAAEQFYNRFILLLFFDIEEVMQRIHYKQADPLLEETEVQKMLEKSQDKEKRLLLVTEAYNIVPSVDMFMRNIIRCKELYENYIKWLGKQLGEIEFDQTEAIIKKLEESSKIKGIVYWRKKNDIKSFYDLIPVQDMEVLAEIIAKFKNVPLTMQETIVVTTEKLFRCIAEEFKEVEKVYCYDELHPRCYSKKINELSNLLELDKIPMNLAILLGAYGRELDDTVY